MHVTYSTHTKKMIYVGKKNDIQSRIDFSILGISKD